MGKVVNLAQTATGEQKVQNVSLKLKGVKNELADVLARCEEQGADEKKLDALTEALDALEDAYDALEEVLMDER